MSSRELTEQEAFWQGEFGNAYVDRNQGGTIIASNLHHFAISFAKAQRFSSLIEFGTNRGLNLIALKQLFPQTELFGVELNKKAYEEARDLNIATLWNGSFFDYPVERQFEVSMSKGVLIHLNPDLLPLAYEKLYQASSRYILISEYYNPAPVEVTYRGHEGRLFKRDFAGEMLDRYGDLKLVDYGFFYHRDPNFPKDDPTWFLLEKAKS